MRLRAVGPDLADQLTRVFEVQADDQVAPTAVDLDISVWDRAHTGVGCPGIPLAPDTVDVLGPGLVSQYGGGQVLRYERTEAVKALDRATQEIVICVTDARGASLSDRSKPFPHLLAAWFLDRGVHVLHAGLVARDGRGLLLGGPGGSGKSTTALGCALAGFDLLGDDAVGTEWTGDGYRGHSCYSAVRFDEGTLQRLPALADHHRAPVVPADRGKHLAYVADIMGRRPDPTVSLEAIVMPVVVGSGPSALVPARRSATLRRLAPSTLLRGLGSGKAGMAHLGELVRRLPCYELQLGASTADGPEILDDLLAGLCR